MTTRKTAVARTLQAMATVWTDKPQRVTQGRQFIKKAKRSDAKRRMEKASRKRNRQ
jgi:hypothetical protein